MNLKKHIKLLMASSIILLATLFFNSNSVQAMGAIVKEGELTAEILDSVLSEPISFVFDETGFDVAETLAYQRIASALEVKGIKLQTSMSAPEFEVWFSYNGSQPNIREVTVRWGNNYRKQVALKYANTSDYNEADANTIEKLFPGEYNNDNIFRLDSKLIELGTSYENYENDIREALNKKVNDSTITFSPSYMYGMGGEFDFGYGGSNGITVFKNNVYYKHIVVGFSYLTMVTVPDDIEDTNEAYVNYALPKVTEHLEKIGKTNLSSIRIEKITDKEDLYFVYADGERLYPEITIRKAKATPTTVENLPATQEIKEVEIKDLPTTQEIKKEEIALNSDVSIMKEIIKKAKEIESKGTAILNIIGAIEVNVIDKTTGENVDWTKPTDIAFSVGEQYNGKLAYIIHQKHNGEYEYFKNVKITNGKVNVTLTGLSPIVVALQDGEIKDDVVQPAKDDSPKTGVVDITNYVAYIALIAGVGIILLKKKTK